MCPSRHCSVAADLADSPHLWHGNTACSEPGIIAVEPESNGKKLSCLMTRIFFSSIMLKLRVDTSIPVDSMVLVLQGGQCFLLSALEPFIPHSDDYPMCARKSRSPLHGNKAPEI